MSARKKRFVHYGEYAAEVDISVRENDQAWGPYISMDDGLKLERVRSALKTGDINMARKEAKVFKMLPLPA